ncbi:hypothetical protein DAPK24_034800 [Pichia kluyveri]|uniref:LicD/FKTN/FKRP nucleotidyltransferase domain-containing protein n=1 Tax=Pichia kluyveri TaxID=36015 RepID=A0AAV5R6H1_PICKL|nr:hypothetical protein DAPK24_034800 [Pichia kluyveri]
MQSRSPSLFDIDKELGSIPNLNHSNNYTSYDYNDNNNINDSKYKDKDKEFNYLNYSPISSITSSIAKYWNYNSPIASKSSSSLHYYSHTTKYLILNRYRLLIKRFIIIFSIIISIILIFSKYYNSITTVSSPIKWDYLDYDPFDYLNDDETYQIIKSLDFSAPLPYGKLGYDPRIPVANYLQELSETLKLTGTLSFNYLSKYKFSWKDWINFDKRLLPSNKFLNNHNGNTLLTCNEFSNELGFPKLNNKWNFWNWNIDNLTNCIDIINIDELINVNYPHFKIIKPIDDFSLNVEGRIVHGALYTLHSMPSPERLIFVDGVSNTNIILPINNDISQDSIDDNVDLPPINLLVNDILNSIIDKDTNINPLYDTARIIHNIPPPLTYQLSREDFENPNNINEIEDKLPNYQIKNSLNNKLYKNIFNQIKLQKFDKYFHETRVNNELIGGSHYDWRFYNIKEIDNEFKRLTILQKMIQAWIKFTNNANIQTWLSHGTLLGHSFNNKTLPWDFDHDVQISSSSMWEMANKFNQSLIIDISKDNLFDSGMGIYLIDINNNFFNRSNENKKNTIDGRFIDIQNGMYIDITQLSFLNVNEIEEKLTKVVPKIHKDLKNEFYGLLKGKNLNNDLIIKSQDLLSCKNNHFYQFDEVNEMKLEIFENVPVYVQKDYHNILNREFPRRKQIWTIEGYTWRRQYREWIKNSDCLRGRFDYNGDSCKIRGRDKSATLPYWESVALVYGGIYPMR